MALPSASVSARAPAPVAIPAAGARVQILTPPHPDRVALARQWLALHAGARSPA
jgi:hypothetical protein